MDAGELTVHGAEHPWQRVLDGDVSPAAMAHVVTCAHCAQRIRDVGRAAEQLEAALPVPSPELDERVLGALASSARRPRLRLPAPAASARRPRLRARPRAAATVALACALATATALWPDGRLRPAHAVPISPLGAVCDRPAADRERVLVAGTWAGTEARRFARVLRRFERRSGVAVAYAYETRDIAAKLEARLRRGCPPDVALLPQPGLLADLARRGLLQPLDDATERAARAGYARAWRRLAAVDGRSYGVWFKAANKSTVWYRPAALRASGVERPPRDLAELRAAAARLHAGGTRPLAVAGADGWTVTDWFENLYLRLAGPRRYDLLARHAIPWTHRSVRATLDLLARLLRDRRLAGPPADTLQTDFEESVALVFGARPRAAMVFEGDFVRAFAPTGADADFFVFPAAGAGSPRDIVVGGDVAALFTADADAQRLMRFLATPEAALPWARAGGFLSPNRRVPSSAYPDALTRRAARALAAARTVRFDLSDLQPSAFGATEGQGMWSLLRDLLRRPGAADAVAGRLERAARAAYACERATGGSC